MANLLQVDAEEAKAKLSIFRTYFLEIVVVTLSVAIIYLFVGQKAQENTLRSYLLTDRAAAIEQISVNSAAITENTKQIELNRLTFLEIKILMEEIREMLREDNN